MTVKPHLVLLGALASLLAACGDDPAPAAPAAAAPKPKAAAPAAAPAGSTAEASQYVYSYNPVAKRDPFRSPLGDEKPKPGEAGAAAEVCPEPLCAFDLEQLALVAVVSGDANPVAMVEDPQRTGHIVHRNTRIGKQGGKVTQILRDCIVITEYFLTPDGKKNPNRVNLCVKQEATGEHAFDLLNNKAVE
jgi:type IV pilus assembly protein PilP